MNIPIGSAKDYEDAALFREFVRVVNVGECEPKCSETKVTARKDYAQCDAKHEENAGRCEWQGIGQSGRRATVNYTFTDDEYEENARGVLDRGKWLRMRLHSYDASADAQQDWRDPMVLQAHGRGFICAYCDAKYVYRRCLVNHLLKNHKMTV